MHTRTRRIFGILGVISALTMLGTGTASAARPSGTLFQQATPGTYTWTVPKGVRRVTVEVYGAAGGSPTGSAGGLGGKAVATFAVQPGQTYEIVVGGQGGETGTAGSNGGGAGYSQGDSYGGGGGGATDVRGGSCAATLSCGLADRILVAGGGGGGAVYNDGSPNAPYFYSGGVGGGLVGGDGAGYAGTPTGGTQTAGGTGTATSDPGSFGAGSSTGSPGGGGGGGWFGGAGGHLGSGSGGSGYVSGSALSGSLLSGVHSGDGMIVIKKS